MPKVFMVIDAQMKEFYAGKQTRDLMPFLPPGIIDPSSTAVHSIPLAVPGHASKCIIKGKLDTIVKFCDNSYAVIDFKTSKTKSDHLQLYSRQLHAYALGLENAAPGKLAISPVTRLGLVVFEPGAFLARNDSPVCLTGSVGWTEIRRNDAAFLTFLGQVLDLLELSVPPEAAPTCDYCIYREKSRRTSL
jgi:PD-(D/E)XK nuclease superfamily protein